MGQDYRYSGTVTLKQGVTFSQLDRIWRDIDGEEVPDDFEKALPGDDEDGDYEGDPLTFSVTGGELSYDVDGYSSIGFGGRMEDWLSTVAEDCAAEPWTCYEQEGEVTFYGPSDFSIKQQKVRHWKGEMEAANRQYMEAVEELLTVTP